MPRRGGIQSARRHRGVKPLSGQCLALEITSKTLSDARGQQSHFKVQVTGAAEGIKLLSRPGK
jgi:hypothetical protein